MTFFSAYDQELAGAGAEALAMKTAASRIVATAVFALIAYRPASAQQVHTINLVTESKERVLRIEAIIPATPKAVWKAFATEEGLKKWMAPVVALDLRVGGTLSTHYNKTASIGSPGTIRLGIVNYLEGELMTYKVNLTSSFKAKARAGESRICRRSSRSCLGPTERRR